MNWGLYLLGMVGVVAGLMAVEQINAGLVGPYVLLILLSVALFHPSFLAELRTLIGARRGGTGGGNAGG